MLINNTHDLLIAGARPRTELVTPKDLTEDATQESPSPKPGRIRPRGVGAGESSKPKDPWTAIPPISSVEGHVPMHYQYHMYLYIYSPVGEPPLSSLDAQQGLLLSFIPDVPSHGASLGHRLLETHVIAC